MLSNVRSLIFGKRTTQTCTFIFTLNSQTAFHPCKILHVRHLPVLIRCHTLVFICYFCFDLEGRALCTYRFDSSKGWRPLIFFREELVTSYLFLVVGWARTHWTCRCPYRVGWNCRIYFWRLWRINYLLWQLVPRAKNSLEKEVLPNIESGSLLKQFHWVSS